jgi:hypothetical protein
MCAIPCGHTIIVWVFSKNTREYEVMSSVYKRVSRALQKASTGHLFPSNKNLLHTQEGTLFKETQMTEDSYLIHSYSGCSSVLANYVG